MDSALAHHFSMQHFKFEQHGETWRETLRDENEPIANLSQQSRLRIKPRVRRDASALGSLQFLIIVLTYLICEMNRKTLSPKAATHFLSNACENKCFNETNTKFHTLLLNSFSAEK